MAPKQAIVIGAGNWGTTLAIQLSHCYQVRLWARDEQIAAAISEAGENARYLPGIKIPQSVQVEAKFASPIAAEDRLVLAVPSSRVRQLCDELRDHVATGQVLINVAKGVQADSLQTVSQLIGELLPQVTVVVLTGPTIAREIAQGEPARAVLSCERTATLLELAKELKLPGLSFEMSRDVEGAELCSSLKGLIGIAVGIADGLDLNANVQGVLMTYGLREFRVIAEFLKVPEKTVYGLSGMGDLITTCISEQSRNRRFGRLLAQGVALNDALSQVGMVVEGVAVARTVVELARFNLQIPLFKCIAKLIFEGSRDVRAELIGTLESIS